MLGFLGSAVTGAAGALPNPPAESFAAADAGNVAPGYPPQLAALDLLIPGFSVLSGVLQRYLGVDLSIYIPAALLLAGLTFLIKYLHGEIWDLCSKYFMSSVDIRVDDDMYNMLMPWVVNQKFAKEGRRTVANMNINSRSWAVSLRRRDDDDIDDDALSIDPEEAALLGPGQKPKPINYTPAFGSHWFWYKGHLMYFRRFEESANHISFMSASEQEVIRIFCFGRSPHPIKELLRECRLDFLRMDAFKTIIYRSSMRGREPKWQRCMARKPRHFSTVILDEKVKEDLVQDLGEFLVPAMRRWYGNRGIPYRRGYLLYGPPGTGKSSLSLALAGHFRLRIYIISLNSPYATEENLAELFSDLPRHCIVLLEDIDTAGLTHTRDDNTKATSGGSGDGLEELKEKMGAGEKKGGQLSLSGLLNLLDGVASQEGRILIMTTNHLEKLDAALIRPGRVDKTIKFSLADHVLAFSMFKAIFAPLEGDTKLIKPGSDEEAKAKEKESRKAVEHREKAAAAAEKGKTRERAATTALVGRLADEFVTKIPENEFSPAEVQGFLLKHKNDPVAAVAGAEEWVIKTRKEKKQREDEEAEKRRKAREKEEEKKRKKAAKKAKSSKQKNSKKALRDHDDSDDEADTDADAEDSEDAESDEENESESEESEADESETEVEVEEGEAKEDKSEKGKEKKDKKNKKRKSKAKKTQQPGTAPEQQETTDSKAAEGSAETKTEATDDGQTNGDKSETKAPQPIVVPPPTGMENKEGAGSDEKKAGVDSGISSPVAESNNSWPEDAVEAEEAGQQKRSSTDGV